MTALALLASLVIPLAVGLMVRTWSRRMSARSYTRLHQAIERSRQRGDWPFELGRQS
ncbi:hypothetical protein [Actinokineospora sp. UTMC 2448]|uniref:hypothetical protein n=1 Tax=Actinokineospora sp. UTMC 2448 TaxID=2268449 RepID=UPI002164A9D7|nr:hypothetical protein [Actinokineospora sp. UTMC 2448]UVS81814.1 hypothetical protein Actkin_05578 [Actinokineospora sp. UTMC 2448]